MSIWYQLEVTAIAKGISPVAKFFNLDDSTKDVRTDSFEFSFGGKNAPSLTLRKIVQQNPDLVFLVKQSVECDTVEWFLTKFDVETNEQQFLWIQSFGAVENKVSKRLLEEYGKDRPELVIKHLNGQKGFEEFRWASFLNDFDKIVNILKHYEEYKEMVNPWKQYDVKMYIVEFEYHGHKEYDGPYALNRANAFKDRMMTNEDTKNVSIREVEPR